MKVKPFVALSLFGALAAGCASSPEVAFNSQAKTTPVRRLPDGSIDDMSRCEWKGRQDRDVVETAGTGSVTPNVRRVFAVVGQGADRNRVLICREADTNYDGIKDVVRRYNDKGEAIYEEADTNYDGKIDVWLTLSKGRVVEEKLDTNFDGNPDEWKYYSNGRITRAKRDTNNDSKPDVWEMYSPTGSLERIGVDVDGDERVDRWDYDTDVRKERAAKELAEEDAAAKKAEAARKAAEYRTAQEEGEAPKEEGTTKPPPKKKAEKRPAAKKAQEQPK